ncbi:hypothetical protein ACFXGA_09365 [Actinosynnema sp. NPDC059335]
MVLFTALALPTTGTSAVADERAGSGESVHGRAVGPDGAPVPRREPEA